jgi:hypothetical protein
LIEQILLFSSFGSQRLKEIARMLIREHQCQLVRMGQANLQMELFRQMGLLQQRRQHPSRILDDGQSVVGFQF